LRSRRGSALILVLLMTLAVAALAVAAIFMSSSAGLLSRFYDREREYRLAAESALEITRSRLARSPSIAIPDTGMAQLASGLQLRDADGVVMPRVSANVFAAVTGDTSAAGLPSVSLIAQVYDGNGTRYVRRMDLRRESFSRYNLFVDSFPSGLTFGPGTVTGRVHTNGIWRSGTGSATDQVYRDTVAAVGGFSGVGTFLDTLSGVTPITYPRDETYPLMSTLATAANLSLAPVTGSGSGWVQGTRVEFVVFDADGDATIEVGEGYARVFDLAAGSDTSRLRASVDPNSWYIAFWAKPWADVSVQNQCGAFYLRAGSWQFFPVATHRAAWARNVIQATGAANYPAITNPTMNSMDDSTYAAASAILSQPTARCFPAGSPYLMPTERMTNATCQVTGTNADVFPYGTAASGCFPSGTRYGGMDTTFTPTARTCGIRANGLCTGGVSSVLGTWRAFGGTPVSGIASSIRQANELPFLWPISKPSNANSAGVMRITGNVFLSGRVRGELTVMVDGSPRIIESLTQVNDPSSPDTEPCADQLGLVAVGDILVADNALLRPKRIGGFPPIQSFIRHLGGSRDVQIHAQLMSLTGTVGVENPGTSALSGNALPCPDGTTANTAGGCFRLVGGAAMRRYSALHSGSNTGLRWAGLSDRCSTSGQRPPLFPLTSRYAVLRSLEVAPTQANNPTKIRALLMRLKGRVL
jgi:hypothetical protein